MKKILLLFTLLFISVAAFAQTALKGKVVDGDAGDDPLPFASVSIEKEGVFITGTNTDIDGNYSFSNIDPGTYTIIATFTGYATQRLEGVKVFAGKSNVADVKLSSSSQTLDVVEVVAYTVPLVEQDNTTQGKTVTSEEIYNLPTRNINAIAATSAGLASADEGEALNIRGSRSNATDYYVDGIRVQGNLIPESEIDQLQVITGGVESRYGDVSGGVISITTKGPSNKFSGGFEVETTEPMMDIGNNLIGLNLNGPILRNSIGQSILGFRLAGRFTQQIDNDPPGVPVFRVKDEKLAEIEANPILLVNGQRTVAAEFLTNDDVNALDVRPFEENRRLDLNGKLDARLSDAIDISLSGFYGSSENLFTPDRFSNAGGRQEWSLLNAQRNPTALSDDYRVNFRFRHRLGGQGPTAQESNSLIQKASYTLQFGYENNRDEVTDPIHGDNYFDYGHVGTFSIDYDPSFTSVFDEESQQVVTFHSGYNPVLIGYDPSTSANPVLSNYNNVVAEEFGVAPGETFEGTGALFDGFPAINGFTQGIFNSTFNGHFQNVGRVYNLAQKVDNDIITFNANASFQIVPGSSDKSVHNIELGIMYEERTNRRWSLSPSGLWTTARLNANAHLSSRVPDTSAMSIGTEMVQIGNGELVEVNLYPVDFVDLPENQFYRSVRELTGTPLSEFINIDRLNPNDLSLDMFSVEELTSRGDVDFFGYDYLGNEFNGTFDDFFAIDPTTGRRTFNVAPNRPIYTAGYIQDKFTINEMIFRVGVRVDRFDANTRVLKDPYSLYEIQGAADFHANNGGTQPGNIGDDYAVYTVEDNGTTPLAYRNGDQWFLGNGTPVNDPTDIEGIRSGLVFPKYANPEVHESNNFIKEDNFTVETSFKDYEVQFNVMPRLAFSFPISTDANFFAHYDVLVQRPPSNTIATALDYFYFVESAGSANFNNPALRPERTVDYEVGFQQKLSASSAIKLSAYYKELRDMIQSRVYFPVPLVNQYSTFDNQDFGTTKGFSISYDLRRTNNLQVNANYTLQFADGTGSNATSQRGLTNRGNLRTLFPLSFDERHRINLIMDYRLPASFDGFALFRDFGINLQTVAVSGRPYTATFVPTEFGGSGIQGAINGSRRPWNFTVNLRIDKDIKLANNLNLNVYFRVSNLLDRRNVQSVYTVTGSPEDSGFLQSTFGRDALANFEGRAVTAENYLASYQWRLINPDFFSLPRRMYLGARVNF
ncbi:MAG: carboxypeptidase regulatory-like domain-containing protein [Bacteroidota bacterium]